MKFRVSEPYTGPYRSRYEVWFERNSAPFHEGCFEDICKRIDAFRGTVLLDFEDVSDVRQFVSCLHSTGYGELSVFRSHFGSRAWPATDDFEFSVRLPSEFARAYDQTWHMASDCDTYGVSKRKRVIVEWPNPRYDPDTDPTFGGRWIPITYIGRYTTV